MEYLLTFPNTYYTVQARQVLLTRKVAARVFTLPPSLMDGCGIGPLVNEVGTTHSVCFLEEAKVRVASIPSVKNDLGEGRYRLRSPQESVLIYRERKLCQLLVVVGRQT